MTNLVLYLLGMAAGMTIKSSTTADGSYDVFGFGGPVNFSKLLVDIPVDYTSKPSR